ncbi:MAG TPA: hypothetical protein DDZ51_12085 [Planctomycetaceae bacterium]|nr:hypothetical protein [Planctomycetaceae bacterium]
MGEILLHYKRPDPTTWVYLSSFLTIGLFFVFHRCWSMRNLDLVLLILLAPGLLIVHEGRRRQILENEEARVRAAEMEAVETVRSVTGDIDASKPDDPIAAMAAMADGSSSEFEDDEQQIDSTDVPRRLTAIDVERYGFIWLLSIQVLILIRLLLDPLMIRRPLLDPNLTSGGLLFIGVWLFIFMMANVITSTPRMQVEQGPQLGPGYSLMNMLPAIPTRPMQEPTVVVAQPVIATDNALPVGTTDNALPSPTRYVILARFLAIFSHLAIVVGIISIGYRHFGNMRSGVGCATLYLMLPYTAQMTGRVDHALPAALLVWAVLNYRRPLIAGLFLGATAGLVYYPLFLLPLWASFYWRLGVRRFALGVGISLVTMMALLVVDGSLPLGHHLMRMFGLMMPLMQDLDGVWGLGWEPIYRLPILVGFLLLSGFFAIWPAQKNLGTLIGFSAALMVAAQFWHAYGGGLYMAWFLPLLLLTIVRPNLEDRVALKVIDGGRLAAPRRPRIAADVA